MNTIHYFVIFLTLVKYGSTAERISAKKCAEYTQYSRKCSHGISPLFGYRPAMAKEFPHSALIGARENRTNFVRPIEWFCSGILISEQFVITLAECGFVSPIMRATHVRLGDFNYGNSNDGAVPIDIAVAEVIVHPNFTVMSIYNNIGLLQLEKPTKFNAHIRPACLPQAFELEGGGATAMLSGWPFRLYSIPRSMRHKQDMQLRKYEMKLVSLHECKQTYAKHKVVEMPTGIIDTQICATIEITKHSEHIKLLRLLEHIDGSPLQVIQDPNRCMYTVLGVSHIKASFGLDDVPLVFTRIYPYLSWIEEIVWSSSMGKKN